LGGELLVGVVEDARYGGIDLSPWGKFDRGAMAVYPLLFHMLDVAAIALELWDRFLTLSQRRVIADGLGVPLEEARRLVAFFAGCHDLGKLSGFQECEAHPWARVSDGLRADTGGWERIPHERASMHAAVELLAELGYDDAANAGPAVRVAQILGAHHGRFLQVDVHGAASPGRVRAGLGGPKWQDLRRRYLAQVQHQTGATVVPPRVSVPAAVLITGVGTVADRLASQRHYWLPKAQAPAYGAGEHYALACKEAPQVVDASGLARIDLPEVPFAQAHPRLDTPNELQTSLMTQLPPVVGEKGVGIVVVTDVTGGGKTVGGLELSRIFNAACGTAGLCWLMPTTATADAVWEEVEGYVAAHRPERAPVTLVRSYSWLNTAYTDHHVAGQGPSTCDEHWEDPTTPGEGSGGRPEQRVTVPDGWLRGWDRALLAQFTVATHDQAMMAALPVRFNALRLLALSGKTVVIDEAHALTPFSHLLLSRLVHWLGAFGCPVVVLSATLPASVSDGLVRDYLTGAGRSRRTLAGRSFAPPYPGWLFADAATASVTVMDAPARTAHAARHRRHATLHLHPVQHRPLATPGRAVDPGERLAAITEQIAPVARHGGTAAVVCATVADAQDTYQHLRHTLTWPGGTDNDLVLLHARLPGHQREAATRRVRAALGPAGPRPDRLVVITTSLFDMSLDVDVDLMVSDLASIARLLQRLGRLWRFETAWGPDSGRRPSWIRARGAQLTVLHPVDGEGRTALPAGWHTLEPSFLTHATAALLGDPARRTVTLPDQVQQLVEQIHGDASDFARTVRDLLQRHTAYQGTRTAEEHLSASHLIPPPERVSSLADLHRQHLTAQTATTRLGAMPQRLLPCYRTPGGTLTLDPAGTRPLPTGKHLTPAEIRTILQHTLPAPAAWTARRGREHTTPDTWHRHPLLADLVLLPHDPTQPPGTPLRFDRHLLHLDPDLGLVHRKT
jgi:CRISPR-associated endonuclease/helicase Cas3